MRGVLTFVVGLTVDRSWFHTVNVFIWPSSLPARSICRRWLRLWANRGASP
jgi:hypothetical protein